MQSNVIDWQGHSLGILQAIPAVTLVLPPSTSALLACRLTPAFTNDCPSGRAATMSNATIPVTNSTRYFVMVTAPYSYTSYPVGSELL